MPPLVSIVICNYNYGRFLPTAIESALSQRYSPLEVVVVDDGSVDGSRELIERYVPQVRAVLRPSNGGHAAALNSGLTAAKGDVVLIVDADDYLREDAAARCAAACTDGCARVQFRLEIVDENGNRRGADPPLGWPLPSGDLVPQLLEQGRYLIALGNAYPRWLLEAVLPIPERDFPMGADAYLHAVAPFHGRIVSIEDELGSYRRHGHHFGFSPTRQVATETLRARIEHDRVRERYIRRAAAERGIAVPEQLLLRDWRHVRDRLSLLRLDENARAAEGEGRAALIRAGVRSLRRDPELPTPDRVFLLAMIIAIGVLPRPLAYSAINLAAGSASRPAWLKRVAAAARRLGGRR